MELVMIYQLGGGGGGILGVSWFLGGTEVGICPRQLSMKVKGEV